MKSGNPLFKNTPFKIQWFPIKDAPVEIDLLVGVWDKKHKQWSCVTDSKLVENWGNGCECCADLGPEDPKYIWYPDSLEGICKPEDLTHFAYLNSPPGY